MRWLAFALSIPLALTGCSDAPQERAGWKTREMPAQNDPPRSEDEPVPDAAPAGGPAVSPTLSSEEVPPVALPVTSIQGDWTLTSVDGRDLPQAQRMTIHVGRDRIEFSNCQQVTWGYSLEDGTLLTRRVPAITIDINPKPLPCAAPFAPQVERMVAILDTATRVDPFGSGRVMVKATAGRLVLSPR